MKTDQSKKSETREKNHQSIITEMEKIIWEENQKYGRKNSGYK